jgi:hypothetical protein
VEEREQFYREIHGKINEVFLKLVALGFSPGEGRRLVWSTEQWLTGKSGHRFRIVWPQLKANSSSQAHADWWIEYTKTLPIMARECEEADALKSVLDFCP